MKLLAFLTLVCGRVLSSDIHLDGPPVLRTVQTVHAIVTITDWKENGIYGVLHLDQSYYEGAPVHIHGHIGNLPSGKHAFHVHTWGNLTGKCDSTGAHFNPDWASHGARTSTNRHNGDLGNIEGDQVDIYDERISLFGRTSVLGRAIVIHEKADTFQGESGDAGGRIACGIIGRLHTEYSQPMTVHLNPPPVIKKHGYH